MSVITNPNYWDCECSGMHYIHAKADRLVCPNCGAKEDNMPDARESEIKSGNHFWKSQMRVFATSEFDDFADTFQIPSVQAKLLLKYMDGSGYGFAIKDGVLFRIDIESEDADEYTINSAVEIVREWIDDFVKELDIGLNSTDDYTLSDVKTEDNFTLLLGDRGCSNPKAKELRVKLLQFKLEDTALAALL